MKTPGSPARSKIHSSGFRSYMHVTFKYENKLYVFGDQLITVSVLWAECFYHMKKLLSVMNH